MSIRERDKLFCEPVRILPKDSLAGARFGGSAPRGVVPLSLGRRAQYLLTVPWNGAELSVFTAFVYAPDDPDCIWGLGKMAFEQGNPFVEAVLHAPAPRSGVKRRSSQFRGHALLVEPQRSDFDRELEGHWPDSKLGGLPVFYDAGADLQEVARNVIKAGFTHALQLSTPTDRDALVEGSWPFGDWVFHIFIREGSPKLEFRFIWG
jgi:hypothetical protein